MAPAISNIVLCRPPENKLKNYPDAIAACTRKWLPVIIQQVQPKVIVVMGALAASVWMPGLSATQVSQLARSCVIDSRTVVVVGAFHPSYIARGTDPEAWPSLLVSLKRARDITQEVY